MTKENKFKKFLCILLMSIMVLSVFLQVVPTFALEEEPTVDVDKAIAIDVKTGTSVYSKNKTKKVYPGGLTKLMTAIVAAESNSFDEALKTQIESMLLDGNDQAVNKIVKSTYGTTQNFCKKMNEKAKKLGCKNTNFTSATGNTTSKKNYSTMSDLGKITKAFMAKSQLKEMIVLKTSGKIQMGQFLLSGEDAKIKATAVLGQKDKSEFAVLTLGGLNNKSNVSDCKSLLQYAFDSYRTYTVVKKGKSVGKVKIKGGKQNYAKVYAIKDLCVTLPAEGENSLVKTNVVLDKDVNAPIKANQVVGKVQALEAGEVTAQVNVVVQKAIGKGGPWSKIGISDRMMIIIVIAVVVIFIAISVIKAKIRRRKRKIAAMKRRRREQEAMRIAMERAEKKKRDWPY